jgi:hypothetical protein
MGEIREIGLEKELFLVQNEKIKEPKLYGFPYDEMGFLIELRSLPSDRLYPVYTSLKEEELQYTLRANKFGMHVSDVPFIEYEKEFVDYIADKYKVYDFEDKTKNIYDIEQSHHLGIFDLDDMYKLTSGVHVHFSSRDSNTGEVIDLPIEEIVEKMDDEFEDEITLTYRQPGEWESKTHGFEYRSLPSNIDLLHALKTAFRILRDV